MNTFSPARRAFLAASIGTIATAAIGQGDEVEVSQNINDELLRITNNLSGLVPFQEKHFIKGAAHGLINIEQCHWCNEMTEKEVPIIHTCQTQIRSALLDALTLTKEISAYEEGRYKARDGKDVSWLQTAYDNRSWKHEYSRIAQLGAMGDLERDEKLRVFSAEKEDTFLASGEVSRNVSKEKWKKIVHEDREDALLDLIVLNKHRIAWTSFGYRHNFEDTVDRWNADNPEELFSLITLRPKVLQKKYTFIPFF